MGSSLNFQNQAQPRLIESEPSLSQDPGWPEPKDLTHPWEVLQVKKSELCNLFLVISKYILLKTQNRLMFAKFSVLIGLQNISIDPHFYKDIPQMSIKEELTDWQLI